VARQNIQFTTIDLLKFCRERIFEICAIEVNSKSKKIIVGCIYRSPSGDVAQFLKSLEDTLSYLYKFSITIILCGDLNINYILETPDKKRLGNIMKSLNLSQIVDFPTRITNNTAALIDCIFLDTMLVKKVISYPHINGLSDHDAQIVILDSFMIMCHKDISKKRAHSIIKR